MEAIAHPAKAPAAPVALLTKPACPLPFAVVVTGPFDAAARSSERTVSGWNKGQ